jgi:hypothetical protein
MPTSRLVMIKITGKPGGKTEDLSIEPSVVWIRGANHNEEVRWKSTGRIASYTIDFNYQDGSPFAWASMASDAKGEVAGAPIVPGPPRNPPAFAYTITAQLSADLNNRARTITIDPEVVVDDSTPPPIPPQPIPTPPGPSTV